MNIKFYRLGLRILFAFAAFLCLNYLNETFWVLYDKNVSYELNIEEEDPFALPECSPVNFNYENTSVEINGVRYPRRVSLSYNKSLNFDCIQKDSPTKHILIWQRFFGTEFQEDDEDLLKKANCPVTNCVITHNKSLLTKSHLVFVHMPDKFPKLPLYKPLEQRWIFGIYESPLHSRDLTTYNNYFNLTSTYNLNSDFPNFYRNNFDAKFTWKINTTFNTKRDFSIGKNNLAFALISNCNDKSKRLEYIEKMREFMPVEIYGKCGKECPKSLSLSRLDCKENMARKYKFYLAFENSVCNEYITEKLFDMLNYEVLPVVLGAGYYEEFVRNIMFLIYSYFKKRILK
jgi:hypothetical protein